MSNSKKKDCSQYGDVYWCVETPNGPIVLCGDTVKVMPNGALVISRREIIANGPQALGRPELVLLALQADQWERVYAASVLDATPVAVTCWDR